jgi:hypothetical protein
MMIYENLINMIEVLRKNISQKMKHFSENNVYTNAHKNKNCDINIFIC